MLDAKDDFRAWEIAATAPGSAWTSGVQQATRCAAAYTAREVIAGKKEKDIIRDAESMGAIVREEVDKEKRKKDIKNGHPYACVDCDATFETNSAVRAHRFDKHEGKSCARKSPNA